MEPLVLTTNKIAFHRNPTMGNRWLGTHVTLGQFGSRWSKSNLGQSCCNAFVSQIISIKHLLFHRLKFIMGECDICATLLDLCVASHPLLQGLNLETLPKVKLATPPYSDKFWSRAVMKHLDVNFRWFHAAAGFTISMVAILGGSYTAIIADSSNTQTMLMWSVCCDLNSR